jgi:hypothetical protein
MVGDHYNDIFQPRPWYPSVPTWPADAKLHDYATKQEVADLRRQVEEMKALLIRAKEYDERNGEPDCEMEDKVALLKKIAKAVGVDLSEVFGK